MFGFHPRRCSAAICLAVLSAALPISAATVAPAARIASSTGLSIAPAARASNRSGDSAGPGFMLNGVNKQVLVSDNDFNVVNIYPQAGRFQQLSGQITQGLARPYGMVVARNGDLYVANAGNGTVSVYHRGALQPYEQLSGGPPAPSDVALDSHGNVYVVDLYSSKIFVYAKGATRPTGSLTDSLDGALIWIAIDAHDDIFVNGTSVEEFPAGSTQAQTLVGIAYSFPGGIAMASDGTLAVCDQGVGPGGSISFYAPPYNGTTLLSKYPYGGGITGIAFLPNTHILWGINIRAWAAQEYNANGRLIGQTSSRKLRSPMGIAVDPGAGN